VTASKSTESWILNPDQLKQWATELRALYLNGDPFPHIVIDDFLLDDNAREIASAYPASDSNGKWRVGDEVFQKGKRGFSELHLMPACIRNALFQLNSPMMLTFLEELTGQGPLIPDPYMGGGGLQQTPSGGYLKVHHDFQKHQTFGLDRKINFLLYLTPDWEESYGGAIELWNRQMDQCVQKVFPKFNRCVIFTTDRHSYHGLPDPICCPDSMSRRSIALYYWGMPKAEVDFSKINKVYDDIYSTWHQRPDESFPNEVMPGWLPPGAEDPFMEKAKHVEVAESEGLPIDVPTTIDQSEKSSKQLMLDRLPHGVVRGLVVCKRGLKKIARL
jgi:hypothetical protein